MVGGGGGGGGCVCACTCGLLPLLLAHAGPLATRIWFAKAPFKDSRAHQFPRKLTRVKSTLDSMSRSLGLMYSCSFCTSCLPRHAPAVHHLSLTRQPCDMHGYTRWRRPRSHCGQRRRARMAWRRVCFPRLSCGYQPNTWGPNLRTSRCCWLMIVVCTWHNMT